MRKDENYIPRMSEYVKRNLAKGYKKDTLKWALVNQGHSRMEVEKAFKLAEDQLAADAAKAIVPSEPPKMELVDKPVEKQGFWKKLFG